MENQITDDYVGPEAEDELSKSWNNLQKDVCIHNMGGSMIYFWFYDCLLITKTVTL